MWTSITWFIRLDAVDAYERKLVKQIEVAAACVEGGHNKAYVRLLSVSNKTRRHHAPRSSSTCRRHDGVQREDSHRAGRRRSGTDHRAGSLCRLPDRRDPRRQGRRVHGTALPGGEQYLRPAKPTAMWTRCAVQRQMIRRTIKEHLDKEMRLRPQGIKVLSLFFIDAVEQYRQYDADGNAGEGQLCPHLRGGIPPARQASRLPDASSRKSTSTTAADGSSRRLFLHRQEEGRLDGRRVEEQPGQPRQRRDDAYNLIMKDKEKLLSFDTPLKFIFSHSALREGWDNPNVFQICALREMAPNASAARPSGAACGSASTRMASGCAASTSTRSPSSPPRATSSSPRTYRRRSRTTPASASASWRSTSSPDPRDRTPTAQPAPLGFEQSKALWEHLQGRGLCRRQGQGAGHAAQGTQGRHADAARGVRRRICRR